MPLVKVRRSGQITLPTRLRKVLGLAAGDFVEVSLTQENALLIKPSFQAERRTIDAAAKAITQELVKENRVHPVKEVSEAELEAMIDVAKQRVFERHYAKSF